MSNTDSPAGNTGGPSTVPALDDLPAKMRVHALARLLALPSRDVLAALADLGLEARSAQSSIDRKTAEQVVSALLPGATANPESPEPETSGLGAPASAPSPEPTPVAAAPLAPLFAPPAPLFQPPTRPERTRRRTSPADPADDETAVPIRTETADETVEPDETSDASDVPDDQDDADGDGGTRRRRRRGRRGRGRGRGADGQDDDNGDDSDGSESTDATESTDDTPAGTADEEDTDAGDEETDEDDAGGSRRRRRRRRRRGSGEDASETDTEKDTVDPPNTVVRVRQPRESRSEDTEGDGVQSVRGSTRLEAKRQRRRDGRDAGRRRVPILSEAEFLARRESVDRTMVVRERGDRTEIGVLEDDILVEHFITDRESAGGDAGKAGKSTVGNIYLGRVQNVLPSMEAAFVDIGRGRNAVLYAGEVDWDSAGLGGKARRIEQALSSGDSVLVQVTKDPVGHKGARLTTQINLAGRFLVYVPAGGAAGISRKLPDIERRRLKDMLKEIIPSEAGVIIRTASEGVSHQALERDVRRLQAQWEVVKTKSELTGPHKLKAPTLLYEEPDMLIKVVRDQFNEDFSRLVVSGDDAWDTLSNYVGHVAPELTDRIHRHVGPSDVFTEYRIDEQLLKALDRKVWLPSGGTLVIDRTEAMTVVDVNTGKFTGSGGNLEETVTRNNLEAAEEVVRQLRLRDIGGIIVIDFIDMVLEANRDLVLRRLTECLSRDRTRHQVAEVTSLGLVQMTRKRVGGGLLEHFSAPCEHCRGRGLIVTAEQVPERVDIGRGPDREAPGRRARGGRGRRGDNELDRHSGPPAASPVPATAPIAPTPIAPTPVGPTPVGRTPVGPTPVAPTPVAPTPVGRTPVGPTPTAPTPVGPTPIAPTPVGRTPIAPTVVVPDVSAASVDTGAPSPPVDTGSAVPAVSGAGIDDVGPAGVAPGETVDDEVENVVVEREAAALASATRAEIDQEDANRADTPHAGPTSNRADAPHAGPTPDRPDAEPASSDFGHVSPGGQNGHMLPAPARRQRRGRVTRTAGAPTAAGGGSPAVTVPTTREGSEPISDPEVAATLPPVVSPQPESTAVSRPRRARRAASRPAGPPAVHVEQGAGGDPV
ncbi:MAG: translation initiation factor IF-2 N-terminal domain-containing protein [Pseudonocardia sp.]